MMNLYFLPNVTGGEIRFSTSWECWGAEEYEKGETLHTFKAVEQGRSLKREKGWFGKMAFLPSAQLESGFEGAS